MGDGHHYILVIAGDNQYYVHCPVWCRDSLIAWHLGPLKLNGLTNSSMDT